MESLSHRRKKNMASVSTFLVILIVSILLTKIATVALTHTGLSRVSARFQGR